MQYYFITGTSYGLGKALAEQLLQRDHVHVYGISRSCTIQHANYTHVTVDLGDLSQLRAVTDLFKQSFSIDDELYLVNNAGIVDPIKHVKDFSAGEIQALFNINLLSAVELTNAFLQIPPSSVRARLIVNVSSGAASKVSDGWALYGSSKSALDHFTLHVAKELEIDGAVNTRIFSVAPGVVDTGMQRTIRETTLEQFSTRARFDELYATNQLVSPEHVAKKYLLILDTPADFSATVFSARDIQINEW